MPESIGDMVTGVLNLADLEDEDGMSDGGGFRERMAQLERQVLVEALDQADWNQTAAAKALDLPLRTFARKIKKLGIRRR